MSEYRTQDRSALEFHGMLKEDFYHQRQANVLKETILSTPCKICLAPHTEKAGQRAYDSKMAVIPGTPISIIVQCQECGHLVEFEETK